ncbi:MAG: hypothetical protein DRN95_07730 [Candidatus Hydrothermarchaeota archaeon]|nr:MAG: hypothetical protein DRN95_07730 [Candidatus Hydrothermarchaeota archaeon]
MKQKFLDTINPIIDKAIELINRNNEDELVGRLAILAGKAQKENADVDAAMELMVLAFIAKQENKLPTQ